MSNAPFVGRKYFDIQPLNNVTNFSHQSGQSVIRFSIPSMPNTLLNDVLFCGKLKVNTGAVGYDKTMITGNDADNVLIGLDNVNGIHSFISKIECNTRQGNVNIEQQNSYDIIAKIEGASNSSVIDLNHGRNNNMNIISSEVSSTTRRITGQDGTQAPLGVPFSVNLKLGILDEADSRVDLGQIGGLEIVIYLNSDLNALFNISNDPAITNKLDTSDFYQLSDIRMFGSYQMYEPQIASQFSGINFKKRANNMQVVNSSNDTTGFSPQVSALDNLTVISQPNSSARNNFNTNSTSIDSIVGQKGYKFSKDGMPFPTDYSIDNLTSIPDIPQNIMGSNLTGGFAEAAYFISQSAQGKYPPYHMVTSPQTEAEANQDLNFETFTENTVCNNFLPIAVSYQYGFKGFNTNMQNSLIQLNVQSSVNTNDINVNVANRGQAATQNNIFKYNNSLQYSTLMVQK